LRKWAVRVGVLLGGAFGGLEGVGDILGTPKRTVGLVVTQRRKRPGLYLPFWKLLVIWMLKLVPPSLLTGFSN
jgi:hypothetical protein